MILFVYRIWIPMMNGSPREKTHVYPEITHGWMDIHECFQENEGTSGTKRKRGMVTKFRLLKQHQFSFYVYNFFLHSTTIFNVGPRNLNTSTSKKDKKKVGDFLVDEDDDVQVIDEDEDDGEEEEEELEEGTMTEDDGDIEEELDLSDNE